MALVLNQWVTVGQASQTKAVQTSSGLINFTLTYYLEAKLTSQNVELNRSYGEVRARVTRSGGTSYSSSMTATCSNCSSFSGVVTPEAILTTGSFELIGNDEGDSALHLVGSLTAVIGDFSISVDAWAGAPTIPRASSLTFDTNTITLNGTNKFNITINRASSSFTHTLKFERSTASATITGAGASTTFQPSVSKWMPVCGSKKNSVTVTLTTYSGSTKIGDSKTYTIYLNVDQTAYKPVISSITISDTNTATSAVESDGSYIKGRSNLQAVVVFGVSNTSYVSLVGATITCGTDTRSIRLSGTSSTQTVTFTGISSSDFRVTVTDARGVTATSTRSLTIIPYTNINIISASYTRVNDNGESTEVGNHIKLKVVTSGFVGTFGQSDNVQTLSYRYKLKSSSTWSSYITLGTYSSSSTGSVTTHTFNIQPNETFSYSNQYDVQVRVVDQFSNKTLSIVIHQGLPITAYAANHFDVYGEFHTHDRETPSVYATYGMDSHDTRNAVTFAAFGFITSAGKNAYFFIPLTKMPVAPVITQLLVEMRVATGGYLDSAGADLTSEIAHVDTLRQQGLLRIVCTRSAGYGVTNNTPMIGNVTLTYSY